MAAITRLSKIDATLRTSGTSATVAEETNYTVSWSALSAAGFANGDDVLVIGRLSVGADSISGNPRGETRVGSTFAGATVVTGSEWLQEPQAASSTDIMKHYVGWFARLTLATNDNIYTATGGDGSNAAYTGDFSLLVIKLDDLTENTDFLYAENTTPITTAPTSYDTSGASVTVPSGGDDWLLLAMVQFTNDQTNQRDFAALGFGGTTYDEISLGEEDTAEIMSWTTMRYAASVSSSTTLQALYYVTSQTGADIALSRVFALRLDAFRDHAGVQYDPGDNDVTINAAGGANWFEVAGLGSYAHGGSGANDLVLFAKSTRGTTSENKHERFRVQIGGSDVLSSIGYMSIRNQNTDDRPPLAVWGITSQSNGTLDIDVDVQEVSDVSPTLDMVNHTLVAFSAELATAVTPTGTASLALSKPTISASGSVDIDGTASLALAKPTISATGYVKHVVGTAALALATVAIAATGSADISGTASLALPNVSISASGTNGQIVTGTATLALAGPTITASEVKFADVRRAILDAIDGSLAEANSWDTEKANLAVTDVVRTSDTVVTITLSALSSYSISQDEILTVLVPAKAVLGRLGITATPTVTISNVTAVSGTAALALAQPSISASGTVTVSGTASLPLTGPSIAAAGSLAVAGSASLALANPAIAATGELAVAGSAALALSNPSITASGTVTEPITGTASLALTGPVIAATGEEIFSGSAALALTGPVIAATGATANNVGSAALALTGPTIAASGTVTITGTADLALQNPSITAAGEEIFAGTASLVLTGPTIAATGAAAGHIGTAALALAQPSIAASGAVEYSGSAALALAQPSIAASGTVTQNVDGSASLALAGPSIAASGTLAVSGSASLALANPTIAASGTVVHNVSVGGSLTPAGDLTTAALFHRVVGGTLISTDLAGAITREVSHIVIGSLDGDLAGTLTPVFQGAGENYQDVAGTLQQSDLQGTLGIQVQKRCVGSLTPTGALGKQQFRTVTGATSVGSGALATEKNPTPPAGDDVTALVIRLHRKRRLLLLGTGGKAR